MNPPDVRPPAASSGEAAAGPAPAADPAVPADERQGLGTQMLPGIEPAQFTLERGFVRLELRHRLEPRQFFAIGIFGLRFLIQPS